MWNISQYSLRHRSVVVVLMIAILVGGLYAFSALGKREDSTFTIKSAIVTCSYPGATPEEVEADVKRLKEIFPTGLILSPSHEAILPDINPANIEALFKAIKN